MSAIRSATLADCASCRNDHWNTSTTKCWSFPHAVIVPKLKLREGASIDTAVACEAPNCFQQPGFLHLNPMDAERLA
jgi:hypothetical protein